jgi:hypothetical protein
MQAIQSGTTTERIVRTTLLAAMFTGYAAWSLYDGFVSYPRENLVQTMTNTLAVPADAEMPEMSAGVTRRACEAIALAERREKVASRLGAEPHIHSRSLLLFGKSGHLSVEVAGEVATDITWTAAASVFATPEEHRDRVIAEELGLEHLDAPPLVDPELTSERAAELKAPLPVDEVLGAFDTTPLVVRETAYVFGPGGYAQIETRLATWVVAHEWVRSEGGASGSAGGARDLLRQRLGLGDEVRLPMSLRLTPQQTGEIAPGTPLASLVAKVSGSPYRDERQPGSLFFVGDDAYLRLDTETFPGVATRTWTDGPQHDSASLLFQKAMGFGLAPIGIGFLIQLVRVLLTRIRLDNAGLSLQGRPPIRYEAMQGIRADRYSRTGWIELDHTGAGGVQSVRLDSYVHKEFRPIVQAICDEKGWTNPLPPPKRGGHPSDASPAPPPTNT